MPPTHASAHVRAGLAERLLHNKRSYKETLAPPPGVEDLLQKLQKPPPSSSSSACDPVITTSLPPKRPYARRRTKEEKAVTISEQMMQDLLEKGILDSFFCDTEQPAEEDDESPLAFLAEFDWAAPSEPQKEPEVLLVDMQ